MQAKIPNSDQPENTMSPPREVEPSELTILRSGGQLIGFRLHPHHRIRSTDIYCPRTARWISNNPYYSESKLLDIK